MEHMPWNTISDPEVHQMRGHNIYSSVNPVNLHNKNIPNLLYSIQRDCDKAAQSRVLNELLNKMNVNN